MMEIKGQMPPHIEHMLLSIGQAEPVDSKYSVSMSALYGLVKK